MTKRLKFLPNLVTLSPSLNFLVFVNNLPTINGDPMEKNILNWVITNFYLLSASWLFTFGLSKHSTINLSTN